MITETYLTTMHSIKRTKERRNIKNKHSATRKIENALNRGKCAEDFSSWERDYLINESKDNCTAIAYDNYCYIVNENGRCVTMYKLPAWFGKKKHFNGKERIRNFKKYSKNMFINDFAYC